MVQLMKLVMVLAWVVLLNKVHLIKTKFPTAKTNRLNALLPSIFPNAKSGLSNTVVEKTLVINSGRDVTPANIIPPINAPPKFVRRSNLFTHLEIRIDDKTTKNDEAEYCNNNNAIYRSPKKTFLKLSPLSLNLMTNKMIICSNPITSKHSTKKSSYLMSFYSLTIYCNQASLLYRKIILIIPAIGIIKIIPMTPNICPPIIIKVNKIIG